MSHTPGRAPGAARPLRRGAVVLALVALALAIAAVPAFAHAHYSDHPDGSYAAMLSDHTAVYACDQHSDGNRAYVRRTANGGQILDPVYDPDGSGGACGGIAIDPDNLEIFTICVQNEGCYDPIYRGFGW